MALQAVEAPALAPAATAALCELSCALRLLAAICSHDPPTALELLHVEVGGFGKSPKPAAVMVFALITWLARSEGPVLAPVSGMCMEGKGTETVLRLCLMLGH